MSMSPMLLLHICGGTIGVLSGGVTAIFRKGSRRHSVAGLFFVGSMLTLAGSGVYMAVLKSQPGNILGGTLTFYLVATAWMAARQSDGRTQIFDWAALLVVLAVAAVEITFGVEAAMSPTGMKYDYPPWPFLLFGTIAGLAALGDIRLMVRKGIFGAQRIARHLWRMCFAWFIASASIFLARPHLFPAFMRRTGLLYVLTFLPLALLIFWMIRVRFKSVYTKIASQYQAREHGQGISRARWKQQAAGTWNSAA